MCRISKFAPNFLLCESQENVTIANQIRKQLYRQTHAQSHIEENIMNILANLMRIRTLAQFPSQVLKRYYFKINLLLNIHTYKHNIITTK